MAREYRYYRHGNARMEGTLRELGSILGKTPSEMQTLVRYGKKGNLNGMLKAGKMPEHVEMIRHNIPEYALYAGEEILADGTMDEIAEVTGLKRNTVRWYGTPSGQARGQRVLVRIDEEIV